MISSLKHYLSTDNWPKGEETISVTIFPSWSLIALILFIGISLTLLFLWWKKRKKR